MTVRLSTVIMADPRREAMVAQLRARLDRDVPVVWDQHGDRWETGRRALLARDPEATHHLVLQDDAVPCRDLLAGVERAAVAALPGHPLSLYAGMYRTAGVLSDGKRRMAGAVRDAEARARDGGPPWLIAEGPWWGVALVIPAGDTDELVRYGDAWKQSQNYDSRIGRFYIERGLKCWYTMPSLVEHRHAEENPSLIGHDNTPESRGRVAHWFAGEETSALDIDWTAGKRRRTARPSLAIMAHPRRAAMVRDLERQLPGAPVAWDRKESRWETGRRALLLYDPGATHHLVVQDDAVPCRDLRGAAERALETAGPERPVSFYTGTARPYADVVAPAVKQARDRGSPWIEMPGPWWGVAIAVPSADIEQLIAWCDRHDEPAYDARIAAFYAHRRTRWWYTTPSLCDHRPAAENPSIVPGREGDRRAVWFLGRRSTASIDWSVPPVRAPLR